MATLSDATFWTGAGGPGGRTTEPKRQSRFILSMDSVPVWVVKRVTKPSLSITEAGHQFLNHTFYYPGKLDWAPIDVTLVDPIDPDMAQTFLNIIKRAGYNPPTTREAAESHIITKNGFRPSIGGQISIKQITDGYGPGHKGVLEEWVIYNPFITSVQYGDLSYDSDELVQISVTMRYDYADLVFTRGDGTVDAL